MPSASYSRPRHVSGIEAATAVLRAEGHRVTAIRRIILEALLGAEGPVSAERLAAGISGSDLTSVYRNLELLERLGLVRHVHIGHGPGLYAMAAEDERCYVVCEHCNRLERLPQEEVEALRERIGAVSGFEAHFSHFPVLGLCPDCAARRDEGGEAPAAAARTAGGEHRHEHSHGDRIHSHPHTHTHGDGPGAGHDHEH